MRIGELATKAGVTKKAVRYYESRGVLPSNRTRSGYREFDGRALEIIRAIRAGQRMGLKLEELRNVLDHVSGGIKPCADLRRLIANQRTEVTQRIKELQAFDSYLGQLEAAADNEGSDACPILARADDGDMADVR